MPTDMITRIVFRLGVSFHFLCQVTLTSTYNQHSPFLHKSTHIFIPGFSQSFDHEFFCHPPFLIAFKCSLLGSFSFRRFFLFRITNTVSSLPSLRIESIKVTLTNLSLVVFISTDFYAYASNVVLVSIIKKTGISSVLSIHPKR